MKRIFAVAVCAVVFFAAIASAEGNPNPRVALETSLGTVVVELDQGKAPISTQNFLSYVDSGHYAGTVFHRVIKNFMVQGGGLTEKLEPKPTQPAIKNEAGNGLLNKRGTIAMARTGVVDSATSQFFINVKDNTFLDHRDETPNGFGYAVFGKVVEGMDVVDKIEAAQTGMVMRFKDVPLEPIFIKAAKRLP